MKLRLKTTRKGLKVDAIFWVLAAGVIIFLLFGWLAGFTDGDGFNSFLRDSNSNYMFFEDFARVGQVEATFSELSIGDIDVGITTGERKVQEVEALTLQNGFFAQEEHIIELNSDKPEGGLLTFKVIQTNRYGNLRVTVNEETIFNTKILPSVSPEIELTNLKDGKNTIVIEAESSGPRFWAPTIYQLADLKLKITDFGEKYFERTLRIRDYELNGFDRGELTFFIDKAEREAPLTMRINDVMIYDEYPINRPIPYKVTFTAKDTQLAVGENRLDIFTGELGEYHIENALLRIFYFGRPNKTVLNREFGVRSSEFNQLGREDYQGLIEFDGNVIMRGNMQVVLNNNSFDLFPRSGINRVFFDQQHIKKGINELTVETDATMDINNFTISVVRKR